MTAALPKINSFNLMRRLIKIYLRPYFGTLGLASIFMLIAAAMTAMIAKLMQPILDDVLNGHNAAMIVPVGITVLVVFVVRGLSTYLHTVLMNKIGQYVVADIQKELFSHFLTMDMTFFNANPSGQLISRVINDVNVMRQAVTDSMTGFGKNFLTLVFLIGVMFYQDWKLALAALTIFPFVAYFVVYLGRKLRTISRRTQNEMANLSDRLSQIFQGIRQVHAYGMEAHETERAGEAILKVRKLNMKSVRVGNILMLVNETLIGLVLFGIIIYGGYQAIEGKMTAGQLASFLAAFTLAYEPMKKTARLNAIVQMGLGAAERVFEMLDLRPSITDRTDAVTLQANQPEISFENVEFQYAQAQTSALNGVSFTAMPGKVTALVGPSGGGKTTIINLIPRLYDVSAGTIKINGQDIRDYTLASLRARIALVSQDITIFDDTIAANIAYGSPGADMEYVMDAARAAAAHDFISSFPEQYETRVGEDGTRLSGGQRQRIAIARAVLRNAPILLMDEATSALDNESEKTVQDALKILQEGRTTIVIAHRLSTVRAADQIIVLDKGQISERGRHEELMGTGGLYKKMYETGLKG
ncbi:MAG: ABC transporter ATP-binding protein [Alphaproteobacteria bacterium]